MQLETTLFVNHFSVLDFAFLDEEKGLCGESLHISAALTGELDHQGFIMDFGKVKKLLKQTVDESLDHCLAVPEQSKALRLHGSELEFSLKSGLTLRYQSPLSALAIVPTARLDFESISLFLKDKIRIKLPSSVRQIELKIEAEAEFQSVANFRYTHGLKYHDGNCQRLLHGHRNPIEVYVNRARSPELELYLAEYFAGAHFVAKENLVNFPALDIPPEARKMRHPGVAEIAYRSGHGNFSASLPACDLIILESEPSIENITAFAWRLLQREKAVPVASLAVHGYEGLQKGAIVSGK